MFRLHHVKGRIERLRELERGFAKETAAQTARVWWAVVSVEQKQYVAALCRARAALQEARAALAKAAQKLEGHPFA